MNCLLAIGFIIIANYVHVFGTTASNNITTTVTPVTEENVTTTLISTTTEIVTTTCSATSTCNENITTLPTTTTPKPKSQESKNKIKKQTHLETPKEGCSCNNQRTICDINCCCDSDCTIEDRQVFGYCKNEENIFYDTRYCDYIKYIYENNTQQKWHVNQNSLFCIASSNLPASYLIQKKQPLLTFEEALLQKTGRLSWVSQEWPPGGTVKKDLTVDFIYGSPTFIIRNNKIQKFDIDVSWFTDVCNNKEQILYLKNAKTTCSVLNVGDDNKKLNFITYFHNISILATPNAINKSKFYDEHFQGCPKNICLPITAKICDENFNVCVNILKPDKKLEISCQYDLVKNTNTCKNVVKKAKYNIYHNGTNGIKSVEVLMVLTLVKYEFSNADYEHYIDYEVNFLWVNQSKSFSAVLSGSPGYNTGKPILIGCSINFGNKSHPNFTISRDSLNYLKNFLVVPKNINGVCVLNNHVYNPIEFGYNLLTKCKYRGQTQKIKNEHPTNICRKIQRDILFNWLISEDENRSYGYFGDADSDKLSDWWPILLETSIKNTINNTIGNFINKNESLYCLNIISGLEIDIFHTRIDFKNLINQEKILGITFKFNKARNTSFSYENNSITHYFEMDLKSKVMFYDISIHKRKKFVDPPTFEVKLPYDFFYPFIRVYNNGNINGISYLVFLVVLCVFL